jgi:hypothetical protein
MATTKPKSGNDINQGSAVTGVQDTGGFSKTTSEIPVQFTSGQYTTKFDDYGLRRKTVEIGTWDMDTTADVEIKHGLIVGAAWKNVRSIEVTIRNDDDNTYYTDSTDTSANADAGIEITKIDEDVVYLARATLGTFDSVNFDKVADPGDASIVYNRGWITVWYV